MSIKVQIVQKILFPWQTEFDEKEASYYFFNPVTNESVWKLPENIRTKLQEFIENMDNPQYLQKYIQLQQYNQQQKQQQQQQILQQEQEQKQKLFERQNFDQSSMLNMERFLTPEIIEQQKQYEEDLQHLMKRPARKQVEENPSTHVAYTQGGLDYNIWYNSHDTDELDRKQKVRERAQYRLDPDLDTGFTKADLYEKNSSYFCVHFARGMCCQGDQCKYYHRVPTLQECYHIDESRDVFGRPRHSTMKHDMGGVGSFMTQTRTLMVSEFKCRKATEEDVKSMYEVIWRHFSVYGIIEDINLKPTKSWAFIRFTHRCFAEFCKEAMINQALDNKEMILVRWAEDDNKDQVEQQRKNKEQSQMVANALQKKFNNEQLFQQQQQQKLQGK